MNTEDTANKNWFSEFKKTDEYKNFLKRPVAYFCAEYSLSSSLPTYAGGLGILSGDYVREAAANDFPLISIGLRYRHAQSMLVSEKDEENAEQNQLSPLINNGQEVIVSIPIGERIVKAKAFEWNQNNARVFLLDTNIPENDPLDRDNTKDLYTDEHELRLRQEIILGIGGFILLETLGITPSIYHLNEGHSAFLSLALLAHEMKEKKVDFETAKKLAREQIFFTNHTLVLEGQERFPKEMVEKHLDVYTKETGIPMEEILILGKSKNEGMFSMTALAFHMSIKSNAVSKIHAEKANILWPDEHPTHTVTNGIYLPRWDKLNEDTDLTTQVGIWNKHQENKKKLLEYIAIMTGEKWDENTLLFGWARRFVEYKQPLSFIKDAQNLRRIAENTSRPLRIIFSGPTGVDPDSYPLVAELRKIIETSLKGIVVFIPNYNTSISELMVGGCDVWLNTPVVGREACGTSGMKAALNGALPLSTRDGWVAEADLTNCGWVIDEPDINEKMLEVTEKEIVPLYYENNSGWVNKMKNSRNLIEKDFSMTRALRDYIEKLYLPIHNK